MSSLTTVLQFCFVVFHCTFIYSFFKIIAMIDGVLLRIAGRPMGHLFFGAADCVMMLLIDAAAYPITKKQNFSAALFLPAFIIVQWVRISSSVTLFLLAGRTISSPDVKGVLESVREMLQDVFIRGSHHGEHHRRLSFSQRMLNVKSRDDSEVSDAINYKAEKETNKKTTYSDSNTQTSIHFSPDTSVSSELATHSKEQDKVGEDTETEYHLDDSTSDILDISHKNLQGKYTSLKCSTETETEVSIDQLNIDNLPKEPPYPTSVESQTSEHNADHSKYNEQKESISTEGQMGESIADNSKNEKGEQCTTEPQERPENGEDFSNIENSPEKERHEQY